MPPEDDQTFDHLLQRLLNLFPPGHRGIAELLYYAGLARRHAGLHVRLNGTTGAGKSYLSRTIAECVPDGELVDTQVMTPNALKGIAIRNGGFLHLGGKLLHLDECVDGQRDPSFMRTLISDGRVSGLHGSGHSATEWTIDGRFSSFDTTTAVAHFEEDDNRRLCLALPESDEIQRELLMLAATAESDAGLDTRRAVLTEHVDYQRKLPQTPEIDVPFGTALASVIPLYGDGTPRPRLLRHVLTLTKSRAYARATTDVPEMTISATLADYQRVFELLVPALPRLGAGLSPRIEGVARRILDAHAMLAQKDPKRRLVSRRDLMEWTQLTRQSFERIEPGLVDSQILFLLTRGTRGRPHEYRVNPDAANMLDGLPPIPSPDEVREAYENNAEAA